MLSITLLSTPAWADRFAAMNLLHDTQGMRRSSTARSATLCTSCAPSRPTSPHDRRHGARQPRDRSGLGPAARRAGTRRRRGPAPLRLRRADPGRVRLHGRRVPRLARRRARAHGRAGRPRGPRLGRRARRQRRHDPAGPPAQLDDGRHRRVRPRVRVARPRPGLAGAGRGRAGHRGVRRRGRCRSARTGSSRAGSPTPRSPPRSRRRSGRRWAARSSRCTARRPSRRWPSWAATSGAPRSARACACSRRRTTASARTPRGAGRRSVRARGWRCSRASATGGWSRTRRAAPAVLERFLSAP